MGGTLKRPVRDTETRETPEPCEEPKPCWDARRWKNKSRSIGRYGFCKWKDRPEGDWEAWYRGREWGMDPDGNKRPGLSQSRRRSNEVSYIKRCIEWDKKIQEDLIKRYAHRGLKRFEFLKRHGQDGGCGVKSFSLQRDPGNDDTFAPVQFDHKLIGIDVEKQEAILGLRGLPFAMDNQLEGRWTAMKAAPGMIAAFQEYDESALYRQFPELFVIELDLDRRREKNETDAKFKRRLYREELRAIKTAIFKCEARRDILQQRYQGFKFPWYLSTFHKSPPSFKSTFPDEFQGGVFKHQLDHVFLRWNGTKRVVGVRGYLPFSDDWYLPSSEKSDDSDAPYNLNWLLAGFDYFKDNSDAIDDYLARPLYLEDPSLYVFRYSPNPPVDPEFLRPPSKRTKRPIDRLTYTEELPCMKYERRMRRRESYHRNK